jgi:hypothetical protein
MWLDKESKIAYEPYKCAGHIRGGGLSMSATSASVWEIVSSLSTALADVVVVLTAVIALRQWDVHGPLPASLGNGTLWGTTAAMRRLAELILHAARLAEEEDAWHAHTAGAAAAQGSRVA